MLFPGKSISSVPVAVTGMALLAPCVIVGSDQQAAGRGGTVAVAAVRPYHAPPLHWTACRNLPAPGPDEPQPPRNLQCATLTVPLDYANPSKGSIRLALIRTKATDRNRRLGSLVFNFGGPGGSGIDPFAAGAAALFEKLGTRYDLVGFDPRGVGQSSPVTCLDGKQKDTLLATDTSPDNARETIALIAAKQALVQGCRQRSGKLLPHVGTVDAVQDLDVLRAALGDSKLNYFGLSYGTWLGAAYAHQFPKRVGRAVLDAAVNPQLDQERLALQQAASFQRVLDRFSQWADQQPQAQGEVSTGNTTRIKIATLLKRLDAKPIRTDSGRRLTQSLGEMGILLGLYAKEFWPEILEGIEQATAGDGTILLDMADAYPGRDANGNFTNILDATTAIACADTTERYTVRDVMRALPKFAKASPIFGRSFAWGLLNCTGWSFKGSDEAQRVDAPGAPPIVVIGTTGDPATPYDWAPWLAKAIGPGVLLTLKGEGHGAYPTGDSCIHEAVDHYLLDGRVPAHGTTCP